MSFFALLGCPVEHAPVAEQPVESCLQSACHAAVEQIHYGGPALTCVDCHGGDNTDATKEGAHVTVDVSFNPSTPGNEYLPDPTSRDLDAMDLDVLRFLNPSDYRVAPASCGTNSTGGVACHGPIVDASLLLNRATLAGQLAGGGFIAGAQGKEAMYGVVATHDPTTPGVLPDGTLASVQRLPSDIPGDLSDDLARAYFPVYEQLCVECHVSQEGPRIPGRYYASGCAACHIETSDDSRAGTADITQDRDEMGHVATHRFTNLIPDKQCAHCHISHLSRSMLAQGVRERSEPEGDEAIGGPNRGVEDPENHEPWPESNYVRYQGGYNLYGKPYPFYIEDEDDTNDVDETPPDVHTAAGMGCIDCHNIREAHGNGTMKDRMDGELDVRCQSCHGQPGALATLHSVAGLPFEKARTTVGEVGVNEPVFQKDANGNILELGRFTNALHPVTQIDRRTNPDESSYNPRTRMGCELHAGTAARKAALKEAVNALAATDPAAVATAYPGLTEGFTFALADEESDGRVECFACHNAWTLNCYGCHMVRDDQQSYVSSLDGATKKGRVATYGLSVLADALSLGFNRAGRISPMVGTAIFFTHIDENGLRPIDAMPLVDGDGYAGEGNVHNPVHHHTTRKIPRDCDGCHPSATGSHDPLAILTATGLGSGQHTFEDGQGTIHLLDRLVFADFDGDGVIDDPSVEGLPDHIAWAEQATSTTHIPAHAAATPGPLDTETINRILESIVVPQRSD